MKLETRKVKTIRNVKINWTRIPFGKILIVKNLNKEFVDKETDIKYAGWQVVSEGASTPTILVGRDFEFVA